MERINPMLGDVELQQVQQLDIDADQVLTLHEIPALEGGFFQKEGRRATKIVISGVVSGEEFAEGLKNLRQQFHNAEVVSFVSDIVTATDLDKVIIEEMEITEVAGKTNRFEYAFTLLEYTEPPSQPTEPPPEIPPKILIATLIVEVIVNGNPQFDFSRVNLTATGTQSNGDSLSRLLTNRNNNVWTEEDFPPGQYNIEAVVVDPQQMRGEVDAAVRDGETTQVSIILNEGTVIAKTFLIHFRFDSAFSEPCMLLVLKQVSDFAAANPNHKLLVLGQTDLAGSQSYNQSLSERRARSAYSVLRFGDDNQAAVDEWNVIRRPRTSGASLGDSWGAREYQQMLQDLNLYHGKIDGNHNPATDDAVRVFQSQQGLPVDGVVGDGTWPVLIRQYLAQHNLSVPGNQFLPNCEGEILKWLGCSELDPVRDVTFAWRPNRRCEFLFVTDSTLPSDVVEPDTFRKPTATSVNSGWCLNDSGTRTRCCFVEPHVAPGKESCNDPARPPWDREPAEPSPTFVVRGSIKFGDGTPYAPPLHSGRFTLIASDGEFMDGEVPTSTNTQRAGTGIKGVTESDGSFEYPLPPELHKRPGIFTLEVDDDVIARNEGENLEDSKGPVVCKRLAQDSDRFNVIIGPSALLTAVPTIVAPDIVVVKKAHTNPQRQPVTLSVNQAFSGTGLFTCSPDDRVIFFTAAAGGTPLQFDGIDNLFTGAQLLAGITLFAQGGPVHSDVTDDITLKLQLQVNGQPGLSDSARMTAVELTLDISDVRTDPVTAPPILSEVNKASPGRFVLPQNATIDRPRAILTVRPPEPLIGKDLELNLISAQLQLFAVETARSPAAPQAPLGVPLVISSASIPSSGLQFFIEANAASAAFRDTGVQLGIRNLEADADRVAVTVLKGDPSQLGLFKVGEHEYTEADEGSFDVPRVGVAFENANVIDPVPPGPRISVRRRAVVRYPADSNGANVAVSGERTSYPLVIVLHGNHRRFLNDGVTFVESYKGLVYICEQLASHGYIALTIDVDDINFRADGIFHRGAAILEHINLMKIRNITPPAVAGQVDFTGKIDESQIFLVGHSRGGEGVLAAENINRVKLQGHSIQGVVSISPTNFQNFPHNTTPLLVIYGSSDGDVSGNADGVNPFLIYDAASPAKSMIFVYAANHNRFSTNPDWLDPTQIDNDDPVIITEAEHKNIAKGYITSFFEHQIRGPIGFDTFFKNYERFASVSGVEVHQQVRDPQILLIDNFNAPVLVRVNPILPQLEANATTNSLGNTVIQTGLALPEPSRVGAFLDALTETELTNDFIDFFVHSGVGEMIAWDSSGDSYRSSMGGEDVARFKVLSFRVTQRFGSARNSASTAQVFSVQLGDTAGQVASILTTTASDIPFAFQRDDAAPGISPLNKSALKTIRLLLEDFSSQNTSLNLASLAFVEFVFDQNSSGEIAVNDIEFSL